MAVLAMKLAVGEWVRARHTGIAIGEPAEMRFWIQLVQKGDDLGFIFGDEAERVDLAFGPQHGGISVEVSRSQGNTEKYYRVNAGPYGRFELIIGMTNRENNRARIVIKAPREWEFVRKKALQEGEGDAQVSGGDGEESAANDSDGQVDHLS